MSMLTSGETLAAEISFFRDLKKLRGSVNFREWEREFRQTLATLGGVYTMILDNVVEEPEAPSYESTDQDEVVDSITMGLMTSQQVAYFHENKSKFKVAMQTVEDERLKINAESQRLFDEYVNECIHWNTLHRRILCFMGHCIDSDAEQIIKGMDNSTFAMKRLTLRYGVVSNRTKIDRFDKLVNMRYKGPFWNAGEYTRQFQQALLEYEEVTEKVGLWRVYTTFMNSIRSHSSCHAFVQTFKTVDMSSMVILDMYHDFILSQSCQEVLHPNSALMSRNSLLISGHQQKSFSASSSSSSSTLKPLILKPSTYVDCGKKDKGNNPKKREGNDVRPWDEARVKRRKDSHDICRILGGHAPGICPSD